MQFAKPGSDRAHRHFRQVPNSPSLVLSLVGNPLKGRRRAAGRGARRQSAIGRDALRLWKGCFEDQSAAVAAARGRRAAERLAGHRRRTRRDRSGWRRTARVGGHGRRRTAAAGMPAAGQRQQHRQAYAHAQAAQDHVGSPHRNNSWPSWPRGHGSRSATPSLARAFEHAQWVIGIQRERSVALHPLRGRPWFTASIHSRARPGRLATKVVDPTWPIRRRATACAAWAKCAPADPFMSGQPIDWTALEGELLYIRSEIAQQARPPARAAARMALVDRQGQRLAG